jgi:hypothetical protein
LIGFHDLIDGSSFMIFPVFLKRGEVVRVFDGVQVGEYGGRNSSVAPVWWMRCAVSGDL